MSLRSLASFALRGGTLPSPFVSDAPVDGTRPPAAAGEGSRELHRSIKRTPRTWVVYGGVDTIAQSLDEIAQSGGGTVRWFVTDPTADDEAGAAGHGLTAERDLLQMRRALPIDVPVPPLDVRAFVPGRDEAEWLEVNNVAFATHPEQGGWTVKDLAEREAEPWFDPAGFLLHHDDETGALAGFVWTKVHEEVSPPLGEIYVIGVDPRFQGRGLGRALTLVGLDWLHRERNIDHGMLYVDGTNAPAIAMYSGLGFETDHIDRSFVGEV
jgi:mycothiol synthase